MRIEIPNMLNTSNIIFLKCFDNGSYTSSQSKVVSDGIDKDTKCALVLITCLAAFLQLMKHDLGSQTK